MSRDASPPPCRCARAACRLPDARGPPGRGLIDSADIPRFRDLGVVANFEALWANGDEYLTKLTEPFLGPAPWHPAERVDLPAMIALYTINAAWAHHLERET